MATTQSLVAGALAEGGIDRAMQALEERINDGATGDELLDACCIQASFAAMRGDEKNSIDEIMRRTADENTPFAIATRSFVKGMASLARGALLHSAKTYFNDALSADQHYVYANLGLATIELMQKNWRGAFGNYSTVLAKLGSGCPTVVRVGLGISSFRMKKFSHAKACLDRALDVDPTNELAMMASVVMALHNRDIVKVSELVKSLFKVAGDNVTVLQRFADVLYLKYVAAGTVPRNRALLLETIRNANTATNTPAQAAYTRFQEARVIHACADASGNAEEFAEAKGLYESAVKDSPALYAGRLNLAKVEYQLGNSDRAVEILAALLQEMPYDRQALRMLSVHEASVGNHTHAMQLSKRLSRAAAAADAESFAVSAWTSRLNRASAAKEFSLYATMLKEVSKNKKLDFTTRANLASLEGDLDGLRAIVVEQCGKNFLTRKDLKTEWVPLCYNFGLLAVDKGNIDEAKQAFGMLVRTTPSLVEAYHQLCEIAINEKNFDAATRWMDLLEVVDPEDNFILVNRARVCIEQDNLSGAAAMLAKGADKSVPVAIAAGAVYLRGSQQRTSKAQTHLSVARDRFQFALKADPFNILAAHGLGCCAGLQLEPNVGHLCIKRVGERPPNAPYVHNRLDRHRFNTYVRSELHKQAITLLEKSENKTVAEACAIAYCFVREGNYNAALKVVEEVMKSSSGDQSGNIIVKYNFLVTLWLQLLTVSQASHVTESEGEELRTRLKQALALTKEFVDPNAQGLPGGMKNDANRLLKRVARQAKGIQSTINKLVAKGRVELQRTETEAAAWVRTLSDHKMRLEEERQRHIDEEAARQQELVERAEDDYRALQALTDNWGAGVTLVSHDADDLDDVSVTKREREDDEFDDEGYGVPVTEDELAGAMAVPEGGLATLMVDNTVAAE